jgi:steroid 5-alpha reductase family enzyme
MTQPNTIRWVLIILGVVAVNLLLANLVWWIVGSQQRVLRMLGRAFGGFFALANVALALVSFLPLVQRGWNWFYIVLIVLALVFAFRFGGATSGRYP